MAVRFCKYRTVVVESPYGRRAILGTQDRVKALGHRTAIAKPPYVHRTVTRRCYLRSGWGSTVFSLSLTSGWKTITRLRMTLRRTNILEVVVRFGALRWLYCRRKLYVTEALANRVLRSPISYTHIVGLPTTVTTYINVPRYMRLGNYPLLTTSYT